MMHSAQNVCFLPITQANQKEWPSHPKLSVVCPAGHDGSPISEKVLHATKLFIIVGFYSGIVTILSYQPAYTNPPSIFVFFNLRVSFWPCKNPAIQNRRTPTNKEAKKKS
jgi:hypothetical protein